MFRAVQNLCVCVCPGIGGDIPYLKVSIWLIRSSGWRASNSVPGEYRIIYSPPASSLTPYPGTNSITKRRGGSVRGRPSGPCQTRTLARISVLPSRCFCAVYFCQLVELWYSVVDHITCWFVRGGEVKCWEGKHCAWNSSSFLIISKISTLTEIINVLPTEYIFLKQV
jgi:hypothetical protein